jgi:hypothetical protein
MKFWSGSSGGMGTPYVSYLAVAMGYVLSGGIGLGGARRRASVAFKALRRAMYDRGDMCLRVPLSRWQR